MALGISPSTLQPGESIQLKGITLTAPEQEEPVATLLNKLRTDYDKVLFCSFLSDSKFLPSAPHNLEARYCSFKDKPVASGKVNDSPISYEWCEALGKLISCFNGYREVQSGLEFIEDIQQKLNRRLAVDEIQKITKVAGWDNSQGLACIGWMRLVAEKQADPQGQSVIKILPDNLEQYAKQFGELRKAAGYDSLVISRALALITINQKNSTSEVSASEIDSFINLLSNKRNEYKVASHSIHQRGLEYERVFNRIISATLYYALIKAKKNSEIISSDELLSLTEVLESVSFSSDKQYDSNSLRFLQNQEELNKWSKFVYMLSELQAKSDLAFVVNPANGAAFDDIGPSVKTICQIAPQVARNFLLYVGWPRTDEDCLSNLAPYSVRSASIDFEAIHATARVVEEKQNYQYFTNPVVFTAIGLIETNSISGELSREQLNRIIPQLGNLSRYISGLGSFDNNNKLEIEKFFKDKTFTHILADLMEFNLVLGNDFYKLNNLIKTINCIESAESMSTRRTLFAERVNALNKLDEIMKSAQTISSPDRSSYSIYGYGAGQAIWQFIQHTKQQPSDSEISQFEKFLARLQEHPNNAYLFGECLISACSIPVNSLNLSEVVNNAQILFEHALNTGLKTLRGLRIRSDSLVLPS